ncbi:MAG TPA: hypothetical protein VEJ67_06955 [Candidatus Cybelea sp.]|nr:hypothetical protein [Candidatus Cybelea sp.]
MAQSILIFEFGTNEEAAQQARHKVEGWKQAFRLGDKIALKFERIAKEPKIDAAAEEEKPSGAKKGSKKSEGKKGEEETQEKPEIRILLRLNFSDHEKLSYQRWLDRIPAEEPFKTVKSETVRQSDQAFAEASGRFDSLD